MRSRLITRRKELGLTQEQLAKELNLKRTTISMYENGRSSPPLEIAIKIKKILKVKDDNIFLNE